MTSDTLSHLQWRAAVKQYDKSKKLSDAQIKLIISAARLAPTSLGLQPFKLIHVVDEAVRKELKSAAWNQNQITDASDLLVFAVETGLSEVEVDAYMDRIVAQRGVTHESLEGYKQMIMGSITNKSEEERIAWASKQAYIALGMTMDVAAAHRIDTTPMEGFDTVRFDEILGLGKLKLHAVVALAVGFRDEDDPYLKREKVRKTEEEFVVRI